MFSGTMLGTGEGVVDSKSGSLKASPGGETGVFTVTLHRSKNGRSVPPAMKNKTGPKAL